MNAISRPQTYATAPYCVEERVRGETRWVAVRARGAESSWLTPHEAGAIGNLGQKIRQRDKAERQSVAEMLEPFGSRDG